jgi:hypothetical protein
MLSRSAAPTAASRGARARGAWQQATLAVSGGVRPAPRRGGRRPRPPGSERARATRRPTASRRPPPSWASSPGGAWPAAGQHRRHVGQPGTSQQVEHERRSEDGDRRRCGGHVADRHDRSPSAPSKGTQRPRPRPAGSTGRRTPFRGRNARVHAPGKCPDRTAALGRRRGRGLRTESPTGAISWSGSWTHVPPQRSGRSKLRLSASLLVNCALARPRGKSRSE